MKRIILGLLVSMSAGFADDLVIFDGKSLDGWHGDPKFWKIEDGTITGESTPENPCDKTTYLRYTKLEVDNFELTLSFRFLSEKGNSGIQYRSKFFPDNYQVEGYQADMETGAKYSGILYDQGGRRILAQRGESVIISSDGKKVVKPLPSGAMAQKSIKNGKWNSYKIIADGTTLTHIINGHKTVVVIDNDAKHKDAKGCIALQMHKGPPMKIQFKDINLLELHHKKEFPSPKWIWADKPEQKVTFTKEFEIKNKRGMNIPPLSYSCDDAATIYINDTKAASSSSWAEPYKFDPTQFLRNGKNTIRVEASNGDGAAGFVLQMGDLLKTDESWQVSSKGKPAKAAKVVGVHGDSPWGNVLAKASFKKLEFETLPGFEVETLYSVPKKQGSWVSIAFDDKGNLYTCDQYGSLYRTTLKDGKVEKVEALKSPGYAQGLCYAYGSLYMSVSTAKGGIFKLTDTNGDGTFDKQEHVVKMNAASEHGGHTIIPSKEGGLYFIAGNFTKLPSNAKSLHNNNWEEDTLLKHLPDARGHARDKRAPGGFVVHMDKDGGKLRIFSTGFRNPYGVSESPAGSVFTYDADMEWDAGTPWYRPTRVMHLTEGAEFGWRTGTSKWPTYYPDSLPAMIDIGPGSPTGTVFGTGTKFPQKYQDALYVLDWTFGRIYALHLTPEGSSYTATKEVFVSGKPLPVADAAVGPDGALYFVTGGRRLVSKLHRVSYTGDIDKSKSQHVLPPLTPVLDKLIKKPSVETAWENLDHADRRVRFTARHSLERVAPDKWIEKFRKESKPSKIIHASIAMSRLEKYGEDVLKQLASIDFSSLSKVQKLEYLRALALCYIRTEQSIESPTSIAIGKSLASQFPSNDYHVDVELSRLLTKLQVPGSLEKILRLMESAVPESRNIDEKLIAGNDRYGGAFKKMMENEPNAKAIQFGLILMNAKKGWNANTVNRYFKRLNEEEVKVGGASYKGFIANIKKELKSHLSPELQAVADKAPKAEVTQEAMPIAKGPGRNWSMEEAIKETRDLSKASFKNGAKMYKAILCAKCHIHGVEGGDSGPNLTNLATRFSKNDILKAIIQPSEEISEQYHFEDILMTDGSTLTGKILDKNEKTYTVAPSAFSLSATMEIDTAKVKSMKPSKISPMPAGLINSLNPSELRDLMKFLTNEK